MAQPAVSQSGLPPSIEHVIGNWLGGQTVLGRPVNDLGSLAAVVAVGLPTEAIDRMRSAARLTSPELEAIIPLRTLSHRRSRGQRLTPEESDRAVRMLRVQAQAELAFGDADKAHAWLRRPLRSLDGARPLDLVATEAGARLIEQMLAGIAWGAAA